MEEIPDNFTLSLGEVEFNSTSLENGTNVIASPKLSSIRTDNENASNTIVKNTTNITFDVSLNSITPISAII